MCSFCLHFKTKKKKICGFLKQNSRIFKNLIFFTKLKSSAVLTFIGYKQTDRQAKFIYRFILHFWNIIYSNCCRYSLDSSSIKIILGL